MDALVHMLFPFLVGALFAGTGTYIVWGRKMVSKSGHKEFCELTQVPIKQELSHLKEGQERLEKKVDKLGDKQDETLKVLHQINGDG